MVKKAVTAAEATARLNANPEYVARRARQEKIRQRSAAENRLAEAPLVEALRSVGLEVASVWDLVNTSVPYPRALPVLLEHLQRSYPAVVRDGIARALAVRDAKSGWRVLLESYRRETEKRPKSGLAAAIAAAADDEVIGDVIALAHDRRQGSSRLLLLSALSRSQDPRAGKALMELRADPELQKEIQVILRRLARRKA